MEKNENEYGNNSQPCYRTVPWYQHPITVRFFKGYLNGCIPFKVKFLRSAVVRSRPQCQGNQVPPDGITVTPDSDSWEIGIKSAEEKSAKSYDPTHCDYIQFNSI